MLRRVVIAFNIVTFTNHTTHQIQVTLFLTTLMLIYQGWVKPFEFKKRNFQELINEVLILLNAYFLIMYSDFVPDPEVRYLMGWVNIGMLIIMMGFNVFIMG